MTFGSLFAGIGGFDLGLERAGMHCRWQVEIDVYASKVLERHWPNTPRFRDVREFPDANTADKVNLVVDLICGGFPCQDISLAGNRVGIEGKRSSLFFELMRIVRVLRPSYVLLENSPSLTSRGLDRVLGSLAESGYDAEWACVQAMHVGASHKRNRIFIVGHADGKGLEIGSVFGKDIQQELQAAQRAGRGDGGPWRYDPADAPQSHVGRVADGLPARLDKHHWGYTPRTIGKLTNRTNRLKCLGNAVVPQVAEFIGRRIMAFDQANKRNEC